MTTIFILEVYFDNGYMYERVIGIKKLCEQLRELDESNLPIKLIRAYRDED